MDNFHPEPFVERCLTGNAQAFEPLVRHYQNAAFATALRDEVLLDKVYLTAFTLCGRIQSTVFEGRNKPLSVANNSEVMVLSNAHSGLDMLEADFMLKSESGAIAIEKTT